MFKSDITAQHLCVQSRSPEELHSQRRSGFCFSVLLMKVVDYFSAVPLSSSRGCLLQQVSRAAYKLSDVSGRQPGGKETKSACFCPLCAEGGGRPKLRPGAKPGGGREGAGLGPSGHTPTSCSHHTLQSAPLIEGAWPRAVGRVVFGSRPQRVNAFLPHSADAARHRSAAGERCYFNSRFILNVNRHGCGLSWEVVTQC